MVTPNTTPPSDSAGPDPVGPLLEVRDTLFAAPPTADLARRLSDAMDVAVVALSERAASQTGLQRRWAVSALGGYGAQRLLFHSDVDLLIACDGPPETMRDFASALLYPLWDAGLAVGHAVRGRREALAAARADIAYVTALLTARWLTGSPEIHDRVVGSVAVDARKRSGRVLALLSDRPRAGSPFELWPDLKTGYGGQRDLDELVWRAGVLTGATCTDTAALTEAGLLTRDEADACIRAQEVLTLARWVAHAVHGRGDNRLDEDVVADLAIDAGTINAALADAARVLDAVRGRMTTPGRGLLAASGAHGSARPITDVAGLLEAVAAGAPAAPRAQEAARAGVLDAAVPGFGDLMVCRRPALSHSLTVGAHCVLTACMLRDIGGDERAVRVMRGSTDDTPLVVAALLHDVGKRADSPDHAAAGAPVAREAALRLGLTGRQAGVVAALVKDHLVLAEAAATKDIDDEDVVARIASQLMDPTLVGQLYVLTAADSLATGPGVWTDWRAALVGELAGKVERAVAGSDGGHSTSLADAIRREVTELARYEQVPSAITTFADGAPLRYLAEHTAEEVVDHAKLAFTLAQGSRVATALLEVRGGPLPKTWTTTIVALDRPGLFATLAGVLSLSGLDILGASAHTTTRGVALDSFTVGPATLADVGHDTWTGLERRLSAAVEGKLAVPVRLAERRAHYASAERRASVQVDIDASGDFSATVGVRAADRVGLLHDLAVAVAHSGLDIRSATAVSADGVAYDTFRVVDGCGEPPHDAELLTALRDALLEAAGS